MDIWSKEKRSEVMSRIRSKNTKPERVLRSLLHRAGLRFRVHCKDLAGCPDIVFRRYETAIFVHGCFWHLHEGCRDGTIPKTDHDKWKAKLLANRKKDKRHSRELRSQGWKTITVWECQIEKRSDLVIKRIAARLYDRQII